MTRYGFMTPHNESGIELIEDIVTHPTTIRPDVVPVWARWYPGNGFIQRTGRFEWELLERTRARDMEPVIYAETGDMGPEEMLSGELDEDFALMAARSRGAAIRIYHEMNGKAKFPGTDQPLFPWQAWPIPQFKAVWQRTADLFHDEGAEVIYCCSHRGKRGDDMLDRWPGDEYVDIVAFDEFRTSDMERMPPLQWAWTAERLKSTGKACWVCETGTDAESTTKRGEWMASLGQVQGIDAILIFDFRIEYGGRVDDWTWNRPMVRAWDALPR